MLELNIKSSDLNSLKKIGEGTEGIVYRTSSGLLFKVYKDKYYITLDSEHMKKKYSPRIIRDAANRQPEIQYSTLPLGPLYIDNHFAGCILKEHRHYVNIHNINILPFKTKIRIIKRIIAYVEELTNHYIYHLDLSNKKVCSENHSNILISLGGDIQIIDLDGRSTTYTNSFDTEFFEMTLSSLLNLITDLLFDLDLTSIDLGEEDADYLINRLENLGLPSDLATLAIRQNNVSYESIKELVNASASLKRLTL